MKQNNKRKPLISALEPRILFDGAAVTTAVDVLDNTSYSNDNTNDVAEAPATQSFERDRKEIAFVDKNLSDVDTLINGIDQNIEVHLIDDLGDISSILQNGSNIDSIHIISHGSNGEITIGNDNLNILTVDNFSKELEAMKNALSEAGDILLYGCNVASNGEGQEFIDILALKTSADIAASDDITGSSILGGDWVLEVSSGDIESNEIEVLAYAEKLTAITIANANDQNYVERETINLAPSISYSDGGFYDKGYLLIEPQDDLASSETLSITSSSNTTDAGEISIIGNKVYVGDGTDTKVIGIIDSTQDGTNGKALRIDFINPLPNGDFDDGTTTGWTIDNNFGGLTGDTHSNGLFGPVVGTSSVVSKDGRTVLKLNISGTVGEAYGTGHSPELVSSSFEASAGDTLSFDWKAERGADYYDIVAYIKDNNTGNITKLLEQRGEFSEWSSIEAKIPYTSDNLEFIFYGGSYDATGGTAISSTFWIDNVAVYSRTVTDAMVTQITRQVQYTNDSYDPTNISSTRDFKVSVENYEGVTQNDTLRLNIIAIDQAPVANDLSTIATSEDTSRSFTTSIFAARVSDIDSNPYFTKIRIAELPSNGTLTVGVVTLSVGDYIDSTNLDNLIYTPDTNWYGTETFKWQAYNNGLLSNEATATINVTSVDDPANLTLSGNPLKHAADTTWYFVDENLTLIDPDVGDTGKDSISTYYVYIKNGESDYSLQLAATLHGVTASFSSDLLTINSSTGITAAQMQEVLRQVQIKTPSADTNSDVEVIFTSTQPQGFIETEYVLQALDIPSYTLNDSYGIYDDLKNAAKAYDPSRYSHLASAQTEAEYNNIASFLSNGTLNGTGNSVTAYLGYSMTPYGRTEAVFTYTSGGNVYISVDRFLDFNNKTLNDTTKDYNILAPGDQSSNYVSFYNGYEFLMDKFNPGYDNFIDSVNNRLYYTTRGDRVLFAMNNGELYFTTGGYSTVNSIANSFVAKYITLDSDFAIETHSIFPRVDTTLVLSNNNTTNDYKRTNIAIRVGEGTYIDVYGGDISTLGGTITKITEDVNDPEFDYYWWDGEGVNAKDNDIGYYLVELGPSFNAPGSNPTDALSGSRALSIDVSNTVPTLSDWTASSIDEDNTLTFAASDFTSQYSDLDNDSIMGIKIGSISSNGILKLGNSTLSVNDVVSVTALASLKYVPNTDYNSSDSFTYYVSDGSSWSSSTSTVNIIINPLNDAPTLATTSSTLTDIAEDTSVNNGETINSFILDAHLNDVDGAITSAIAISKVDNTNGSWQYSLDGTTWSDFSITQNKPVTLGTPILLDGTEFVRFVANTNFAGTTTFNYRPWDKTTGTSGTQDSTIFDSGSTHVGTRDSDIGTAILTVTNANDAPVVELNATNTLAPITEDELTYNTFTVASFTSDKIIDLDPNASTGIAITSLISSGNGTWQYTIDNGSTWADITAVSTSNALLLSSNDKIRFVPNEIIETTASFEWQAWDQSSGVKGTNVDVTTNGTTTPYSINSVTTTLNVTNINDATTITASTTAITIAEDNEIIFGSTEAQNISLSDVDTLSTLDYKLRLGAVHGKLTLGSLNNVTITDGTNSSSNVQIQGKFTDIQNALEGLKYTPDSHYFSSYYGAEKIVIEVVDVGDTGTLSMISTKEIDITVTSVDDTPTIVEIGNDTFIENEDIDAISQNISLNGSLTYDDADLESGDNVDITTVYNNDIVWSGGTIDSALATTLINGFSFTTLNNETSSSNANWTYSVSSLDLDFLSQDETINFSYKFTVTDSTNLSSTKDITISIKGTNDTPTVNTSNLYVELGFGEQLEPNNLKNHFGFIDKDLTDNFRFELHNAPRGIVIDSNTGVMFGKPSQSGRFVLTVKGIDNEGAFITKDFDMLVIAPPETERKVQAEPNTGNEVAKKIVKEITIDRISDMITDFQGDINSNEGSSEGRDALITLNNDTSNSGKNNSSDINDITKTELTSITNNNSSNPDGKLIQASTENLQVSKDGTVNFDEKSAKAFETVGMTIETIDFIKDEIEIKILDTRVGQKYIVNLQDGTDLPDTLSFDPNTGIVKGTLPAGIDELSLSIKAFSSDGTTRILNIKIDVNELQTNQNEQEAKFKTLNEQIQVQNHNMNSYGEQVISLFKGISS